MDDTFFDDKYTRYEEACDSLGCGVSVDEDTFHRVNAPRSDSARFAW